MTMKNLKFILFACIVSLSLAVIVSCSCRGNYPCDDGEFCNGVETCTDDDGIPVCGEGTPPCETDEKCNEETDTCEEGGCETDDDCDDGDLCTVDTCQDATCSNLDVDCGDDECDPDTGECVEFLPTTLLEADGVYTGAGNCGDDDNEVMLTSDDSTVTCSGFTGNGDIPLTLTNDTTATGSNVVAYGTPGHSLRLSLNPLTGEISFVLGVAGTCSTTLAPLSYYK